MLQIGSLVDNKYKIIREIGRGGMSVVWLAIHERLDCAVAVKGFQKKGTEFDRIVRSSLFKEAEILTRLNHPSLPRIFDVVDTDDMFLIIMTYIEGETLGQLLRRQGAQSQELVIHWCEQLCDVLKYLHTRTPPIIYGDMKPDNIMLQPDGELMLLDFGAACAYGTEKLIAMGTRGYAAPEQYSTKEQIDGRADIYGLGVTLHQLVTGKKPTGPSCELKPIRQYDPTLSVGLEQIIEKCTQRDAGHRFQSIHELENALNTYKKIGPSSHGMFISEFLGAWKKEKTDKGKNKSIPTSSHVTENLDMIYYNAKLLMHLQSDMGDAEILDINNKETLEKLSYRTLRLYADYRIVNSNYIFDQGTLPYIRHSPYRQQLEAWLANSDGGAILVTGFRGVGKSTMVHNAVFALEQNSSNRIIPISIVLPAEKKYGQVLVEIIRKLYETLSHRLFWNELEIETKERIRLAYNRTLLNIKCSQSLNMEGEFSLHIPLDWLPTAKTKGSRQKVEEGSYLAFLEQDAEYELIQCIEALNKSNRKNKIVIIIDEIDKMTATQEGVTCFDNLLERMKNLISSTNAMFIFIAGIDIYKRWECNSQKINSLYDSLFGHHIYLPCIWDSVKDLFDVIEDKEFVYKPVDQAFRGLIQTGYTTILEESFQMIEDYILFKGKGLPRKILEIFNDFVIWDNKQPCFMLTENRVQAIFLVSKLLKKFRRFVSKVKITTIYERDIYYIIFFSMLEFLLFQENITFTEKQLKDAILDEQGSMKQYFEDILDKLLREFEELAFIKKTETGYHVIDDTILKRNQSLRILDQNLLLRPQSEEPLPERKDTSVDERFHDQIKLVQNVELTAFWDDYKAEQVIADSEQMMVFKVMSRSSGLQRYAVVYKGEKQVDVENENRITPDNLYSVSSYRFSGPYFLDTEDHIEDGRLMTSLRSAVNGYALEHLIEARLGNLAIYQIIRQVTSLIDYLHREGFGNIRLKPDNIMVCKDAAIKVLDLKHICRLDSRSVPCVTRIYSAPEVYLSGCSVEADFYSVGILLTEMIAGKSLSRYYAERHIDIKTIMAKVLCSQKVKDILVKATAFDPENRYVQGNDLIKALDKCPEFRGMKRLPMPKSKDGTVIGHNIKNAMLQMPTDDIGNYWMGLFEPEVAVTDKTDTELRNHFPTNQEFQDAGDNHTVIFGKAYFDDKDIRPISSNMKSGSREAYLVRQSNNERIVLNKSVFRMGKEKMAVDYCLDNANVSRRHVEFGQSADMFYVKDLHSTNGTYINSEKINPNKVYRIVHGDHIRIANEEFIFNEH